MIFLFALPRTQTAHEEKSTWQKERAAIKTALDQRKARRRVLRRRLFFRWIKRTRRLAGAYLIQPLKQLLKTHGSDLDL